MRLQETAQGSSIFALFKKQYCDDQVKVNEMAMGCSKHGR